MTGGPTLPSTRTPRESDTPAPQIPNRPSLPLPNDAVSALADWVEFRARQLYPDRFPMREATGEE